MSTRVIYVDPSETRMRRYATKVINILGGPGCDKSLYASAIVLKLHLLGKTVEWVPEVAKAHVWAGDTEGLRNQWGLAQQQYRMLACLDGQVQYLVTEGGLPQLLYYNEKYPDNICDVAKTKAQIHAWIKRFEHINIFAQRDTDKPYVQAGRLQDEQRAREIDLEMRTFYSSEGVKYTLLPPDHRAILEWAGTLP